MITKRSFAPFGVIAVLCAAVMLAWQGDAGSFANEGNELRATIWTWNESDTMTEGEPCGNDMLVGGAEYSPYRQIVVRDASGMIIGAAMLTEGTVNVDGSWGPRCGVETNFSLPRSTYYTLTITEDGFDFTIPFEVLEEAEWNVEFHPGF
jgi:hypothetical protein